MRHELNKYTRLLTEERFNPGGECVCPTLEWLKKATSNIGREEGDEIKPTENKTLKEHSLLTEQAWTDPNSTSQWHMWECCDPGGWVIPQCQPSCNPAVYLSVPGVIEPT